MVPLLHACLAEHPRQCSIQHALHSVTEEREVKFFNDKMLINIKAFHLKVVDRTENHYKCILREGHFFLVNILSLSGKYILLNELFLTPILFQFPLDLSLVQYLTSLDKLQQTYCDCKWCQISLVVQKWTGFVILMTFAMNLKVLF